MRAALWCGRPGADNAANLGKFDEARLTRVQKFYVDNQIVQTAVPIKDTYTSDMVGN